MTTQADGRAERDAALLMLHERQKNISQRITVGADKAYDTKGLHRRGPHAERHRPRAEERKRPLFESAIGTAKKHQHAPLLASSAPASTLTANQTPVQSFLTVPAPTSLARSSSRRHDPSSQCCILFSISKHYNDVRGTTTLVSFWKRLCDFRCTLLLLTTTIADSGFLVAQAPVKSDQQWTLIDAARYTLQHSPSLQSQEVQVQIDEGALLSASSIFDGVVATELNQNLNTIPEGTALNGSSFKVTSYTLTQTIYSASFDQLFRNGISIAPSYQVTRQLSSYLGPTGLNTASSGLTMYFPLLRGRGRSAVAYRENVAKEEVSAAVLDRNQVVAQLVLSTANSYWSSLAAEASLRVVVDAERRGSAYVDITQALVDADRVPRNDLHEVLANREQLSSERIAAEATVVAARLQLAADMGMSAEDIASRPIIASDDFPNSTVGISPSNTPESLDRLIVEAISRRSDYRAAVYRVHEQATTLAGVRNRLLPQLDLGAITGYSQAQDGSRISRLISAPLSPGLGPNLSGNINLSFPLHNRAAKGAVVEAAGAERQAQITVEMISRIISQQVGNAVEGVRSASLRVERSSYAVGEFNTALDGARQKYGLGFGSITEILTIEDRLTGALNAQIQAQLAYAQSIAQLRFATGTLVEGGQSTQHIPVNAFVTVPFDSVSNLRR